MDDDDRRLGINDEYQHDTKAGQKSRQQAIFKSLNDVEESPLRRNAPRGMYALSSTPLWANLIYG